MALQVTRDVLAAIEVAAREAFPLEACGILSGERDGKGGARITALTLTQNVHVWPETRFEIDPQALIDAHRAERQGGVQVLGYFHSHPNGLAKPSATDQALALHDGMIWAIHARGDTTFWRDDVPGFTPLSYVLGEG